ncbi:MAG: hypothetical protein ACYSXF_08285 [Planctomycetota bacterium]|jgi:Mn2+/Fe2+ NRAMP family transporter
MNDSQAKFTFWTVLVGIGFLLIAFVFAVLVFKDSQNPAENIVAVLGAVTGVLGTLVGFVAGQAGKGRAEQRAIRAEHRLAAVLDQSGQGMLKQARDANPDMFA